MYGGLNKNEIMDLRKGMLSFVFLCKRCALITCSVKFTNVNLRNNLHHIHTSEPTGIIFIKIPFFSRALKGRLALVLAHMNFYSLWSYCKRW